nr:hypothetical protein [uncultured bacterium]
MLFREPFRDPEKDSLIGLLNPYIFILKNKIQFKKKTKFQ